jgi:8-hydroxy-5-deazaflavin:NADPH oxidoreductase
MLSSQTIGVIGGTGKLGSALARRWVKAGLTIVIGSRDAASAQALAQELGGTARGFTNEEAAEHATIIVMAVPFGAQAATLESIRDHAQGKILLETTVPLVPPKVARVQLPAEGSAAVRSQKILGDGVKVISGFHNVAADKIARGEDIGCDVLVFGDERAARDVGVALATAAGLRGLHAGSLANSAAAEAMTSVLIFTNKFYQVDGAGIMVTGNLKDPA